MYPFLMQTLYYGVVMLMTLVFIDLVMQGFFHKFVMVFGSLGRKSFIKIRHTTYDGIAIGKEEDGFLVFKYNKKEHRIPIPNDEKVFYRFLFVQWVDVDGEKWGISRCDYTPISGFDPVKIQNFIKRILMMPQEDDTFKRTVIILLVVLIVISIALFIFDFILMQKIESLHKALEPVIAKAMEGTTITQATI